MATKRNKKDFANNQVDDISHYMFGKVQPQAREIEEAIIGGMMMEPHTIPDVLTVLKPEHFYSEANQIVFTAIVDLYQKNVIPDLLTVSAHLRTTGQLDSIGGAFAVTEFTNRVTSTANIEYYARIVLQQAIKRELIQISTDVLQRSYSDESDALELIGEAETKLMNVLHGSTAHQDVTFAKVLSETLQEAEVANQSQGIIGEPTHIRLLDARLGGSKRGELVGIGARPGMGKTLMMIQASLNQAQHDCPTAIFSMETKRTGLGVRLLASKTGFTKGRIAQGDPQIAADVLKAANEIAGIPLYIYDTPRQTYRDIILTMKRLKRKKGLKVAYIDYLQLVGITDEDSRKNRDQQIGTISRELKIAAMDLDINIAIFSQLSREVEKTAHKRPSLEHLRESGNIEQDCDSIMLLYRPEYYGIVDKNNNNYTYPGEVFVIGPKNRNGAPWKGRECVLKVQLHCDRMYDAEQEFQL